jgi:hypothetical protein
MHCNDFRNRCAVSPYCRFEPQTTSVQKFVLNVFINPVHHSTFPAYVRSRVDKLTAVTVHVSALQQHQQRRLIDTATQL